MFGLSWGQITIIVLVGVFVLGPERIPTAVRWVIDGMRKLRTMAAGAQAQLSREIGPELDELRRQIADLQSLKELQDLRELRDLHPKRLIGNTILGEEFAGGGISGFLGLKGAAADGASPTVSTTKPVSATPPASSPAASSSAASSSAAPSLAKTSTAAAAPAPSAPAPSAPAPPAPAPSVAPARTRPAAATRPTPAGPVGAPGGRLAPPKVVGAPRRAPVAPRPAEPIAGFDIDAT